MPEISRFFGIVIRMYSQEHEPPHVHAIYVETESVFGIDPIHVMFGNLPPRARSMVVEWAGLHQRDLMENWRELRAGRSPRKVAPLR